MSRPLWLDHPCPTCGVLPQYACRDEDGYFTATHLARVALTLPNSGRK